MATSIETIRGIYDEHKMRYYMDPEGQSLMVSYRLTDSFAARVQIRVLEEGTFLLMTCNDLPVVDASHPMHAEVQQCLLGMNNTFRFMKFSQDASDGEIVASGEAWLEDVELTPRLFHRLMANFLDCLERGQGNLAAILASTPYGAAAPTDRIKRDAA